MLLAETPDPYTIGPNETIEVSFTPIIPKEMISDDAHQNLFVELRFTRYDEMIANEIAQPIQEPKSSENVVKLEPQPDTFKIEPQPDTLKIEPQPDTITIKPRIEPIKFEPQPDVTKIAPKTEITKIEPPEGIPKLPIPAEFMEALSEMEISIVPENLHKADEIIANFKEDAMPDNSLDHATIPFNDKRPGREIGCSQRMLEIIAAIDRLKSMTFQGDAI
jgi:hypothetical protein